MDTLVQANSAALRAAERALDPLGAVQVAATPTPAHHPRRVAAAAQPAVTAAAYAERTRNLNLRSIVDQASAAQGATAAAAAAAVGGAAPTHDQAGRDAAAVARGDNLGAAPAQVGGDPAKGVDYKLDLAGAKRCVVGIGAGAVALLGGGILAVLIRKGVITPRIPTLSMPNISWPKLRG